jgi:hypothetical protein
MSYFLVLDCIAYAVVTRYATVHKSRLARRSHNIRNRRLNGREIPQPGNQPRAAQAPEPCCCQQNMSRPKRVVPWQGRRSLDDAASNYIVRMCKGSSTSTPPRAVLAMPSTPIFNRFSSPSLLRAIPAAARMSHATAGARQSRQQLHQGNAILWQHINSRVLRFVRTLAKRSCVGF